MKSILKEFSTIELYCEYIIGRVGIAQERWITCNSSTFPTSQSSTQLKVLSMITTSLLDMILSPLTAHIVSLEHRSENMA